MAGGIRSTKTTMAPFDLVKFVKTGGVAFIAILVGIASQSEAIGAITPDSASFEAILAIAIPALISAFRWYLKSRAISQGVNE